MRHIRLSIPVLLSMFLLIFYGCTLDKEPDIHWNTNENAPEFVSTDLERVAEHSVSARALLSSLGNLNILRYGWVWSENPEPTLENTLQDTRIELETLQEDSFRTVIPWLLTGKLYHIRPYAVTGSGEHYGKEKEIMLSPTFKKAYEGQGNSVCETLDGGFMLFGGLAYSMYLLKTNALGEMQWGKKITDGSNPTYGYSMQQTTDGGFILLGSSRSGDTTKTYLVKTDSQGEIKWKAKFGSHISSIGYFVQQTTDGGYILVGNIQDEEEGREYLYLIKTNNMGGIEWEKNLEGIIKHGAILFNKRWMGVLY